MKRSFTDTLHITAPAVAPDLVEVLYSLRQEAGFADGERCYVQICPKGGTDYLVQVMESGLYSDKLSALETLQQLNAKIDYNSYVQELAKEKRQILENKLRLIRLRQQHNLPVQLDTLQKYKKSIMLGGLLWGEPKYRLFNNSIYNRLLAYQVLRTAGGHERELAQVRAYLLSERRNGHWRNTYESARILEALLNQGQGKTGKEANSFSVVGAINFETKGFRADTTFTATQPFEVKKQGNLPLYFTA